MGGLSVALAVTLPLVVGDCTLDVAVLTVIPPATVHVVTVSECQGRLRCWERWVESDGKRLAVTRVCTGEEGRLDAPSTIP